MKSQYGRMLGLVILLSQFLVAQTAPQDGQQSLYEEGQQALESKSYAEAARKFTQAAGLPGPKSAAALYWRAEAEHRQGDGAKALQTIRDLRTRFPQSKWVDDAATLEAKISGGRRPSGSETDSDREKLDILNSLSGAGEEMVPVLEKLIQGNHSTRVKERALFVLAESGSPKARQILLSIAEHGEPRLQAKAIESLALYGGRIGATLGELYQKVGPAAKRSILNAFLMTGDRARLLEAARTEGDADLKHRAITLLGSAGAVEELTSLYSATSSVDEKQAILGALFTSGASQKLTGIARSEPDESLRIKAIELLGLMGGGGNLKSFYSGGSKAVKRAVLHAWFVSADVKALIETAKSENDPELRRNAVGKISALGGKESTAFLMELLNK